MVEYYIAVKTFQHPINCTCTSGHQTYFLTINKGDIIEVTNERRYTVINGWYILVRINKRCIFYISLEDLEYYSIKEQLLTMLDIDLKINYLQFKINQALDTGDKVSFMYFSKKINESSDLKMELEKYSNKLVI